MEINIAYKISKTKNENNFASCFINGCSLVQFSQVVDNTAKSVIKTDYLKKSKTQKTVAWVLFRTEAVINIIGITKVENGNPLGYWIAGSATMLASIPFTVIGHTCICTTCLC